jgi:hypothetical protein
MTKPASLLGPSLALALVTAASTASAQVVVATGGGYAPEPTYREPETPMFKQVDARLGLMLGGSDVGDADGFSAGVSGAIGYRMGDATLRGLFDYFRVGDGGDESMSRKGRSTRLGGALRYAFARNDYEQKGRVDFWGELGAGYEHVAWRRGGILDRPSGELAVGLDVSGQGDRDRSGRRRKIGYFMDFRTLVAQGPEMSGITATCGGPCTQATKPSRTDVSMFFELGVHWGR